MKIKFFIALSFLITVSLNSFGQDKYTMVSDDPRTIKKLFIDFNIIQMEFGSPTGIRPGIGAEFKLNEHLYFWAQYDHTLFSPTPENITHGMQSQIEAGTIFSFTSNIKSRSTKIQFRSRGANGTKWHGKIMAKANRQLGVHGGINEFNTFKQSDKSAYYAYASTTAVFAGIAVTTTRDPSVQFSDYNSKVFNRPSRGIWYLDVMVAPSITYIDATDYAAYASSATPLSPLAFPSFKKNPIGARMGYMRYKTSPLPMRTGFEIGSRPGVGNGLYIALKIAISIGFIDGKTKPASEK